MLYTLNLYDVIFQIYSTKKQQINEDVSSKNKNFGVREQKQNNQREKIIEEIIQEKFLVLKDMSHQIKMTEVSCQKSKTGTS